MEKRRSFPKDMALAGLSGFTAKALVYPADTFYLYSNIHPVIYNGPEITYLGLLNRGIRIQTVFAVKFGFSQAIPFALKDQFRRFALPPSSSSAPIHFFGTNLFCGGLTGALLYSFKHSITRRVQRNYTWQDPQYKYFGSALLRSTVYRGLFFGLYDSFKPFLLGPLQQSNLAVLGASSFLLGYGSSFCAMFVSYPIGKIHTYRGKSTERLTFYQAFRDCSRNGYKPLLVHKSIFIDSLLGGSTLALYDLAHKLF